MEAKQIRGNAKWLKLYHWIYEVEFPISAQ